MNPARPIFLFTDFGLAGPYVGQMTGAILASCPGSTVVSLMHDAPAMQPKPAAYLLAACCGSLPTGSVVVAVVDPGVGGERDALLVETPDLALVGPDNGVLSRVPGISRSARIDWRPEKLSDSFHGRDLFGPAAARFAAGRELPRIPVDIEGIVGADWPADLGEVVYIDGYGNVMSGLSAKNINKNNRMRIFGQEIPYARTFCSVPAGQLFWYSNSQGLVEVAANGGSAAERLSLVLGDKILLD